MIWRGIQTLSRLLMAQYHSVEKSYQQIPWHSQPQENRMPWANQWGLSSNVSFSTSPHSPCHPPAKFLSHTKNTSSYGQKSQATTTASTLCGNKIPILKEAFVQFPKAKWLYWLKIDIIIMTPSINLHDHVLTQAGMNKNGAFGKELGCVGGGSSGYTTPATVDH